MAAHGLWTRRGTLALWTGGDAPGDPGSRDAGGLPPLLAAALDRRARARLELLTPGQPAGHDPGDQPDDQPDDDDHLTVVSTAVVHVQPDAALDLLAQISAEAGERPGGGGPISDELAWLADVSAVLLARVRAGAVVPVLDAGAEVSARWAPLVDPEWRRWCAAARSAMPPALRAEVSDSGTDGDHPGGRPAGAVLDSLADALTDVAVRRAVGASIGAGAGGSDAVRAWLGALVDPGATPSTPQARPAAVVDLSERVAAWAASASSAPVELVLRVVEPTAADTGLGTDLGSRSEPDPGSHGVDALPDPPRWSLQVRLRSLDDPSLLLTAEQVRDGVAGTAWTLDADPWAWTLTELARAGAAWPPLLAEPSEGGLGAGGMRADLALSSSAVVALVAEGATALTAAGVAVQLPGRWQRPEPSLRLAAAAAAVDPASGPVVGGALSRQALVDYSWQVALGDVVLTEAELRALAAAKEPLVRLRGEWVQVDAERLARSLAFLEGEGTRRAGLGAVMAQIAAGALPETVTGTSATGPLADLLQGRPSALPEVGAPAGLAAELRPYQARGLAWLASMAHLGLGVVLADDMGLGKTIQLLALLLHEQEEAARRRAERPTATLLVCPMSLVGNWAREAARFAPSLRVHVHHGPDRAAGDDLAAAIAGADLVVTTYAIAVRDEAALAEPAWARVALDEAQHVKNTGTRASRAARAVAANAGHRVALTGTPVENHLGELRSVLDFANPGLLGSAARFRERFAVPIERHGDEKATAALATLTRPFILRRLKTDPSVISDLPPKIEMTLHSTLTAEQATLYQAVLDDMLKRMKEAKAEGIERSGLVLATLTRLKQVCNHPAQLLADGSPMLRRGQHRSGKLALVDDVLDTAVADGERALCFTQYRELGDMLRPHLAERYGAGVEFLHGGVPRLRRDEMVERFSSAAGPPVLVVSLKAGGTGLNLTAANHVIHVDRWWNPAVEAQATDRAFRIGQKRTVQVRTLVCAGTVEERVDEMMKAKRELAAAVVPTGEKWLTSMPTEELAEVLALGADAVGE